MHLAMLMIIQVIIGLLLSFCILLQQRSTGLSATFGGSGSSSYVQRRGGEMILYKGVIWFGTAFFGLGIVQLFV